MREYEFIRSGFSQEGFLWWRCKWAKIYQEQAVRMENDSHFLFIVCFCIDFAFVYLIFDSGGGIANGPKYIKSKL